MSWCKLEIFIPESHLDSLRETLIACDAGHIGRYDACMSYSRVTSTWRPSAGTNPYIGTEGVISVEPELKVEVTCELSRLEETIAAIKKIHPYEEPVINALPLIRTGI